MRTTPTSPARSWPRPASRRRPTSGDCPNGQSFDEGAGVWLLLHLLGDCFHGTHVAGIAVGAGASYSGVAPGASADPDPGLLGVHRIGLRLRSPSPCPLSYSSDQIAALEYVFDTLRHSSHDRLGEHEPGRRLRTPPKRVCDEANAATKAAIDNLRSVGIATVIAAGNDGYLNAIGEPGCISSAISVSATDDGDEIPVFANAAAFLSLWAPGVAIRAPLFGSTGFTDASGTSMATPHVAGAWATLRQAAPSASVDEILTALQDTGVPIPDVYAETSRIRIAEALVALLPDCSNGLDDDGDGLIDLDDPGCDDADDPSEKSPDLTCDDGEDNDGDGLVGLPGGSRLLRPCRLSGRGSAVPGRHRQRRRWEDRLRRRCQRQRLGRSRRTRPPVRGHRLPDQRGAFFVRLRPRRGAGLPSAPALLDARPAEEPVALVMFTAPCPFESSKRGYGFGYGG